MKRRDFLKGMLLACSAPAIVKADSLMKIYVPDNKIVTYKKATFNGNEFFIDTASIGYLDRMGELYGKQREPFESDNSFRERILDSFKKPIPKEVTYTTVFDATNIHIRVGGETIKNVKDFSFSFEA